MPLNAEDNQSQNCSEINIALDSLTISLKPFVRQELRSKFGVVWENKVYCFAGQTPNLTDPYVMLKTMQNNWRDVFQDSLSYKGKNFVGELIDWRNVSTHRGELDHEDVTRALDTMVRLLELTIAFYQTDEIVSRLQQLKSRKLELQSLHQTPPRKIKAITLPKSVMGPYKGQIVTASEIGKADITDPVVLVRIDRSFKLGMTAEELYEETRGDWKMTPEKHSISPQYAIAVAFRVIREVYEIHAWHPVYKSKWYKGGEGYGRQRFDGIVASDKAELIGKSVERYIHPRSSSTITYVNC